MPMADVQEGAPVSASGPQADEAAMVQLTRRQMGQGSGGTQRGKELEEHKWLQTCD